MKEVNAAYAAGDEDALRRILAGLDSSPDAVQGSGIGADLVRVLRQLRLVKDRLIAITIELAALELTRKTEGTTNTDKLRELAFKYSRGNGVERSEKKAAQLYRKAAELGDSFAQYILDQFL